MGKLHKMQISVSKINFDGNTSQLIHLGSLSGCFCIVTAELSSHDRDPIACKPKIYTM